MSENGTELQALRDEIALLKDQLRESRDAIKASDLFLAGVAKDGMDERKRRMVLKRLPMGAYEALEDIGILESVRVSMQRLWHKDDGDFRKAMLHVTKLQWDLHLLVSY